MLTYIITGATSMIGIDLCKYISALGHVVYAVCREGSQGEKKILNLKNIKVVYSDLEHIVNISKEIDNADVFINLAWSNTDHEGRNNQYLQGLNVEYAKKAIRVAAQKGCKLFVESGSQAEYGYVNGLITEETHCQPETEYGKAKLKTHLEGSKLSATLGIKYLHLRIFSVYGANDRPWTLIMTAIEKMMKNEDVELSPCTQNWNFLYVSDCAKQIYLLSSYLIQQSGFSSGVFNIASKDTRQLRDYVEEIKFVLKSSSTLRYGSFIPEKQVSLEPSVIKTENAIGFLSEVSFAEAIKIIVNKNYNIKI